MFGRNFLPSSASFKNKDFIPFYFLVCQEVTMCDTGGKQIFYGNKFSTSKMCGHQTYNFRGGYRNIFEKKFYRIKTI
jgi:hypothetical protein